MSIDSGDTPEHGAITISAHVLLLDEHGQDIALLEQRGETSPSMPGNRVLRHQAPAEVAQRSLIATLGLTVSIGDLLVTEWTSATLALEIASVNLIFDGGLLADDTVRSINLDPSSPFRGLLFSDLNSIDSFDAALATRLSHAIQAREQRAPRYLENGVLRT